ncbi:hypothetical protein G3M48_003264 [Beauveria asiatica]|uniref:GPI anchored serine-threonine rich protein n=1 Tax=Beauveria asiatica TaxID=1069075 RepID=A0AAW0RWQ3_9HYPO
MHALALLSLVASTALVAAQDEYASFQPLGTSFLGTLQARQQQSCASVGGKTCGAKCIRLSYTCCGNGAGACEAGYTCGLAANGIYGCCPLGKRCRGDAPDPSTTDIGVARPTTVGGGGGGSGGGDVDGGDGDESTTTRRLTPTSTPARTTAVVSDDVTISSSSTTSRSASTTRSSAVASGTSGSSVNGAGSDSNSNSNSNGSGSGSGGGSGGGNSNSNGSGSSSTTAGGGGNASQVSSAGNISVGLASLAGGFIAAIASLL